MTAYLAVVAVDGRDVREVGGAEVVLFTDPERPVARDSYERRRLLRLLSDTFRSFAMLEDR